MHVIGKRVINEENELIGTVDVVFGLYDTMEQAISEMSLLVENQSSDVDIVEFFYGVKCIFGPNDSDYRIDALSTVDKIL
jgi:hypothetical protein